MVDKKVKITALLARQEQERAWLFEEAEILDYLEKETGICGERFNVSNSELWGARHIWLGDSIGFNKTPPSLQDIRSLAHLLKPEPLVLIKSACTSFQPVETLTERDTQHGTFTEIIPFYVKIERNGRLVDVVTISWYAKLFDKLYRVEVNYPDTEGYFGKVHVTYSYLNHMPLGIKDCWVDWKFGDLMRDLKVIGKAKNIKWYSGGDLTPNSYTRYWETTDKRYTATPLDLLKNMEGVCA